MREKPEEISVHIRYKDIEKTFIGAPEEIWLLINKFFSEFLPTFEIAKHLLLSPDVEKLAKDLEGIVAFSPEGPNVILPKNRLTDNETLILSLLASYLGKRLGLVDKDSLSKEELQAKLLKSGKITSTRMGELVKTDFVAKTLDEKFRITTFGIIQAQKDILPKVKAKANI